MSWLILILAGFFEVGWAVGLKYTEGFTRLFPSLWTICAMKTLPLGTAYAVWVGVGAVGTVILGVVLFQEPVNAVRIFSVLLILAGLIGLKLGAAG